MLKLKNLDFYHCPFTETAFLIIFFGLVVYYQHSLISLFLANSSRALNPNTMFRRALPLFSGFRNTVTSASFRRFAVLAARGVGVVTAAAAVPMFALQAGPTAGTLIYKLGT